MNTVSRAARAVALAAVVGLGPTACSVGLGDLPLPAPGASGDENYMIEADFANALNLPEKAKVRLGGADVGEVVQMSVHDYTAVVSMRIREGVVLPVGTGAELRTATPLGDVFVSLTTPNGNREGVPALGDGDRIGVEATAAAATIEELLTTASLLVNGGAVRNLTQVVNGLGHAVGDRGERLGGLLERSTTLVRDLADRSGQIHASLHGMNQLSQQLVDQQQTIDEVLDAAGPALTTVSDNASQALELVRKVDHLSTQLDKFPAVSGDQAVGMIADMNRIAGELNAAATDPHASLAGMNSMLAPIISITNGTSAHVDADLQDLAIGALPDPGHPGDPESRIPDQRDFDNFVGTFTYTLLKLQNRITGGQP